MRPKRAPFLLGIVVLCVAVSRTPALDEAEGVNLTADEALGAVRPGYALLHAGFQQGADGALNAPASMNDVNDLTFTTAHAEEFDAANFDCATLLLPWNESSTLGFGLARYAVSNIEIRPAGEDDQPENPQLFTAADWLLSGAFARRFGSLDVGGTLHLLYRQLDQSGLGMRADGMAQYTFGRQYRVGAYLSGLAPSIARWSSGYSEYDPPEASAFFSARWPLPYFYGQLQAGWETAGLFQGSGKSATGMQENRAFYHPEVLLATSRLGAQFIFDFGLTLRAGFEELDPSSATSTIHLGAGYSWKHILGIDYAFTSHPELGGSHRLALQFTPVFPRFDGRGIRPHVYRRMAAPTADSSVERNAPAAPLKIAPDSGAVPVKEILETD